MIFARLRRIGAGGGRRRSDASAEPAPQTSALAGDVPGPLPQRDELRAMLLAALLLGCAAVHLWLLGLVHAGLLQDLDLAIHAWVAAHRVPALTTVAVNFTALGSMTLLSAASALVTLLLWTGRRRLAAVDAALAPILAALTTALLKRTMGRPRPPFDEFLARATAFAEATGYSFPSGHASGIAALLTTIALHTMEATASRGQRWVLGIFHALMLLAVGGSRVYLGVHYASDVLAGLCLGVACGLAVHGLVRTHLIVGYLRRRVR